MLTILVESNGWHIYAYSMCICTRGRACVRVSYIHSRIVVPCARAVVLSEKANAHYYCFRFILFFLNKAITPHVDSLV